MMGEPVKKPGQQPESYEPKKPEMMKALEQAQGQPPAPPAVTPAPATIKAKAPRRRAYY